VTVKKQESANVKTANAQTVQKPPKNAIAPRKELASAKKLENVNAKTVNVKIVL
jgi:hypothetical protein